MVSWKYKILLYKDFVGKQIICTSLCIQFFEKISTPVEIVGVVWHIWTSKQLIIIFETVSISKIDILDSKS